MMNGEGMGFAHGFEIEFTVHHSPFPIHLFGIVYFWIFERSRLYEEF